jgi:hypothetical protein
MTYESVREIDSEIAPGVTYVVARMSFARRLELMRRIRVLAGKKEFLDAGVDAGGKMDGALLQAEIERSYVVWGLREVRGLTVDGAPATPERLAEVGPENLFREALAAVRAETGLNSAERKN